MKDCTTLDLAYEAIDLFLKCDAFAVSDTPRTKEQQEWDNQRMEEVYEYMEKARAALREEMNK